MALNKEKLGKYIERVERRNSNLVFGFDDVRGVSNNKEIQPTKADVTSRSFDRFQILEPKEFVFNRRTTRMGERLGLGYNGTNRSFIFTEDYVTFRVRDEKEINPNYLYIFFRRPEFDRYVRYDSWGSATEFFNWEEMCDVTIDLPPIEIQQKYVEVYNAMVANQKAYEQGLEDLKATCDVYLDKLRGELVHEEIGKYLYCSDLNNKDLSRCVKAVKGISIQKRFIETKADMSGVSLRPYLQVRPDEFAFVTITSRNGGKLSIAHNGSEDTHLVSSSYVVFGVSEKTKLIPAYLKLFFCRSEFDRYSRYNSWGSAREAFSWDDIREVKIPIPDTEIQQSIVDIYNAYLIRREINEKLKYQIKDLCPILIKGSLEEAREAQPIRRLSNGFY